MAMTLQKIGDRIGLICLIPIFFTVLILSLITMCAGIATIDPFVWLITGRSFFLREVLGEK